MPYGLHLGSRMPAHATSTGRVLLAALPRAVFAAWLKGRVLPRLTPHTTDDLKVFRAVIDTVRRDDFAIASEEHELGVIALAVPLRNMKGQTLAALNVVASPGRMDAAVMRRELLPVLMDAARELRPLL
jgi:IclR family transcriptional regulator, pca regulon regulatory protein